LTRSRVCNLQCNDASSVLSYISTDGLSANSSWCRAPNGANDQILFRLFDNYFLSYRCRAPSLISPMNRVIQPEVKSQSYVSVGRKCYHLKGCMRSNQCNVEFDLGRKAKALLFGSTLFDERAGLLFTVKLLLGFPSAVTLRSKSLRTHGHILLSHLRLPQPGGPGPRIYTSPRKRVA
jgi:hypothetical protein